MLDDFMVRAVLAGVGVALVGGPLGCFIVWRRMAYFGDSLAHAALLGVALGLTLHLGVNIGILVVCVALALLLALMERQRRLATDTILGILSHARSEEHTSELQSLMRISYAVFCLKNNTQHTNSHISHQRPLILIHTSYII